METSGRATRGAVPGDDFAAYLGSDDARRAPLVHLETLASMRLAFGRPIPQQTYELMRAEFAGVIDRT